MKRKRAQARKSTDLRGLNPDSPQYWEEVLARENLRMSRGNDTRLIYLEAPVLERIEGVAAADTGRVVPHPTMDQQANRMR